LAGEGEGGIVFHAARSGVIGFEKTAIIALVRQKYFAGELRI
jgi:hypothetical protein